MPDIATINGIAEDNIATHNGGIASRKRLIRHRQLTGLMKPKGGTAEIVDQIPVYEQFQARSYVDGGHRVIGRFARSPVGEAVYSSYAF